MIACAVSHPKDAKAAHHGSTLDWQKRAELKKKNTSDCAQDMMLYERQKVPRQALPIPSNVPQTKTNNADAASHSNPAA
jgi:hypothetical protein